MCSQSANSKTVLQNFPVVRYCVLCKIGQSAQISIFWKYMGVGGKSRIFRIFSGFPSVEYFDIETFRCFLIRNHDNVLLSLKQIQCAEN